MLPVVVMQRMRLPDDGKEGKLADPLQPLGATVVAQQGVGLGTLLRDRRSLTAVIRLQGTVAEISPE